MSKRETKNVGGNNENNQQRLNASTNTQWCKGKMNSKRNENVMLKNTVITSVATITDVIGYYYISYIKNWYNKSVPKYIF